MMHNTAGERTNAPLHWLEARRMLANQDLMLDLAATIAATECATAAASLKPATAIQWGLREEERS